MIDPTVRIAPTARIAEGVSIGAYSIIGADVEIGADSVIGPHVVIHGPTTLGRECRVFQFASLGEEPQDKKYRGEPTRLIIGDRNTIREFVTINRGTVQDRGETRLGDDNWIMANVHIAHDCTVGSRTIFANGASLAGHVTIEDDVVLGGYSMLYQFCRVGAHAITGFSSGVNKDVPPFVTVAGYRAAPFGINSEGLRRRNFSTEQIAAVKTAYRLLYRSDLRLEEAMDQIVALNQPNLQPLITFLQQPSKHGIIR